MISGYLSLSDFLPPPLFLVLGDSKGADSKFSLPFIIVGLETLDNLEINETPPLPILLA